MELYSINTSSGAATLKTAITGAAGIEALAFTPDGTLYAAGSTEIVSASDLNSPV